MEIGYLWIALSLFLFLMTTGAAIALAAVAFPLVRLASEEQFPKAFRQFGQRIMRSYGVLALLSLVFCSLLSLYPPYSFPDGMMGWMAVVFGLLAVTTISSQVASRKLKRNGYNAGIIGRLGFLLWVSVLDWLAGSSLLVYAFVDVVGLV